MAHAVHPHPSPMGCEVPPATCIPATCCCSSGTTPPSSCAPPSPRPSPPLSDCCGRRSRSRDVPVRPPAPTSHPGWSGCLCRCVVPAGGDTRGAVTTLIQLLFPATRTEQLIWTLLYWCNNCVIKWQSGNFPFGPGPHREELTSDPWLFFIRLSTLSRA